MKTTTNPERTIRYADTTVRDDDRVLHVTSGHVAAEERSVLVVVHNHVDGVIVSIHGGHVQRSAPGSTGIHRELSPFVDGDPGTLEARSGSLDLGGVEVGRHWTNLGHVGRLRDVRLAAQYVHRVLTGSRRPVGYVCRPVAIVLAVNLGLRRSLDRESFTTSFHNFK